MYLARTWCKRGVAFVKLQTIPISYGVKGHACTVFCGTYTYALTRDKVKASKPYSFYFNLKKEGRDKDRISGFFSSGVLHRFDSRVLLDYVHITFFSSSLSHQIQVHFEFPMEKGWSTLKSLSHSLVYQITMHKLFNTSIFIE